MWIESILLLVNRPLCSCRPVVYIGPNKSFHKGKGTVRSSELHVPKVRYIIFYRAQLDIITSYFVSRISSFPPLLKEIDTAAPLVPMIDSSLVRRIDRHRNPCDCNNLSDYSL